MEHKCETCKFWLEDPLKTQSLEPAGAELKAGHCHRKPPESIYGVSWGWPEVNSTDFCGEHSELSPPLFFMVDNDSPGMEDEDDDDDDEGYDLGEPI